MKCDQNIANMFSNVQATKFPCMIPLQQHKGRLLVLSTVLVSTNLLLYVLLVDTNILPAVLQGAFVTYDANVYNKTILSLVTQGNETHQPVTVVPRSVWVVHNMKWNNLSLPILTCIPMGRLGNVMGEYASLYALHQHYNVTVVLHPQMKRQLAGIFPNLTIPNLPGDYDEGTWKSIGNIGSLYNYAPIELAASGLLGPYHFQIGSFPFEIQLFHPFGEQIRKEFTFAKVIRDEVYSFLNDINRIWKNRTQLTPIFIGFHVRRTDYANHAKLMFGAQLPGINYFQRAMNYYRRKFGNATVFVAASDDPTFLKKSLGAQKDVFLSKGTSPPYDLALLSSCNHSIITMGSYGFWTGYLAGGEVVYPDVPTMKEYRFSRKMFEKSGLHFISLPVK